MHVSGLDMTSGGISGNKYNRSSSRESSEPCLQNGIDTAGSALTLDAAWPLLIPALGGAALRECVTSCGCGSNICGLCLCPRYLIECECELRLQSEVRT